MDFPRNHSPELKKESRLTSIIDQLLNNKVSVHRENGTMREDTNRVYYSFDKAERGASSGSGVPGEKQPSRSESSPKGRDGLLTSSPEGGAYSSASSARRRQGQHPSSTAARGSHRNRQLPTSSPHVMPTDALATSSTVETNNPVAASSGSGGPANPVLLPKSSEGVSPEPESSSPSVSPHSPSPARGFPSLLLPGFGLAGLGLARSAGGSSAATFSPPPNLERFSPANLAGGTPAIKQMEMMTRNYSDFMRSLAAKYNNQNNSSDSFPLSQTNGIIRGFDAAFPYKTASPFLVRNMDIEGNGGGGVCLGSVNRKMDNQNSPTPLDARNTSGGNNSIIGVGLGPCSVADFSSSQTLLNLVRTASAQSASQLENYLKGAVKRTAEGENRLDPLDLSVTHAKRPKIEGSVRELKDFRDKLQAETETATATGGDCPNSLRTAWVSLLDRRTYPSTTSSRTSPKIALSAERHLQRCQSLCTDKSCSAQSDASDIAHWTVDDVVKFVMSVESCGEYAEKFREQSIDGSTLPLLTEEHLTLYMGLKLGPALKLRTTLARRIGHCVICMHCIHCHAEDNGDSRRHDSSRSPSISK